MVSFNKAVFSYSTLETEPFIVAANWEIESLYQKDGEVGHDYFYLLAIRLSELNVQQKNGGPFGAVLVTFERGIREGQGIGKPQVIGVGANHVVPYHDPSAHAEMLAIQNAAYRQGYSDLSGTILYSSCECCPMCLSIAVSSGIAKICYVNTRHQAAAIDFSDRLQYELFKLPLVQQMTPLKHLALAQQKDYLAKLGSHDAVILDENQDIYAQGKGDTTVDPTNIASINVIRSSVKKHAVSQEGQANANLICWLPPNFTLVSRNRPHPAGLMAADWARLLRKRDPDHSSNPAYDHLFPDPRRIIHVTHDHEQLDIFNHQGRVHRYLDVTRLCQYLSQPESNFPLLIERCADLHVRRQAEAIFKTWKEQIDQGAKLRY